LKQATAALTLILAALAGGPRSAAAQGQSAAPTVAFLNVNVGAQPQQREIKTSQTQTIYDEAATITSTQSIDNGPVFDVTGGYRLTPRFAVAIGVSYFSDQGDSTVVAGIPDPIFTDRPRTVTAVGTDLNHRELGIHLQAVYFVPVSDRFDVSLSAGPSIFRVSQELTPTVAVPARTQNINLVKESQDATAIGINAGVDGNFMITPQFGVGLFVRYAGASVDLSSVEDLNVGGFQTGLGLRVRF
jgi:hypothetical protein